MYDKALSTTDSGDASNYVLHLLEFAAKSEGIPFDENLIEGKMINNPAISNDSEHISMLCFTAFVLSLRPNTQIFSFSFAHVRKEELY